MIELPILRGYHTYRDIFKWCLKYEVLVAGGYVRYMASPLKKPALPGDVDLYVSSPEVMDLLNFKLISEDYSVEVETEFVKVYQPVHWYNKEFHEPWDIRLPIHVIKPLSKPYTVQDLMKSFDLRICCFALKSETEIWADQYGYWDEQAKKIVFQNYTTPLHDMTRLLKYIGKGYTTSATTYLKLFERFAALENPVKHIEEHFRHLDHGEDLEAYLYFLEHFRGF